MSWLVGIHLVEMMPGLFAVIIELGWRGLGAITVTLRRDFFDLELEAESNRVS